MAPLVPDPGFMKADARNIPVVESEMIYSYLTSMESRPEARHAKTIRSGRASYGDEAIGYVQISRGNGIIHVKAKVTPEHRVRASNYTVNCILSADEKQILKASCENCAACLGGCKHAVAFIFWLYRQSFQKSVTDVECYWKKAKLSEVGSTEKFIHANDIKARKQVQVTEERKDFLFNEYVSHAQKQNEDITLKKQLFVTPSLSVHQLMCQFEDSGTPVTPKNFLSFCSAQMCDEACKLVAKNTQDQAASTIWYEYRYGRITASKVYDLSRCATPDGTLVNSVLGATKVRDTAAMARGRRLEPIILSHVETQMNQKVERVGLILKKEFPVFGASPDGIVGEYVVEVKCPMSPEAFATYFTEDLTLPSKKYRAQIMLQMIMCEKKHGWFCVADPKYETNQRIKIIEVHVDKEFMTTVMNDALKFWIKHVFPRLKADSDDDSS